MPEVSCSIDKRLHKLNFIAYTERKKKAFPMQNNVPRYTFNAGSLQTQKSVFSEKSNTWL